LLIVAAAIRVEHRAVLSRDFAFSPGPICSGGGLVPAGGVIALVPESKHKDGAAPRGLGLAQPKDWLVSRAL